MLENGPKTEKAKVRSFAVSNAISSAKTSHIFAGQKHWKSRVDKYRSFNAAVESFFINHQGRIDLETTMGNTPTG
jgi:hypothetical protein